MNRLLRILLLSLAALLTAVGVQAQQVAWTGSVEHLEGNDYRILLEAAIPSGYHMYDMGPYEGGPNATAFSFTAEGAALEGATEQLTTPERHFEASFGMEIGTFAGKARFAQRVRLTGDEATVAVDIEWMICDDTTCMPPEDIRLTLRIPDEGAAASATDASDAEAPQAGAAAEQPAATAAPAATKDAAGSGSLWTLIIEAILWGLAAMLTPCVFPMVPMTVSYFLKGEGGPAMGRLRAALYGLFIVALYTLPIAAIILITRVVGGDAVTADIFNWLATHWLPNLLFFVVLLLFLLPPLVATP